jgi:membrane protease YdiL (CAAX protease family)
LLRRPFRAEFNDRNFRRRELFIELAIFLFLIAPSMAFSFFRQMNAGTEAGFVLTAAASILRDLALVGLVLFFLWRNGEPVTAVGWDLRSWGRGAGVGLALFVPFFICVGLIQAGLEKLGFTVLREPPPQLTVQGGGEIILALALVVVVAVAEETIFRGYLMSRFGPRSRASPS